MAESSLSTGAWIGILGSVAAVGGLWLAWRSEKRREAEQAAERRCDGWYALSDDQIAGHYHDLLEGGTYSAEFYGCLALELEARGYADDAREVWALVVERQIAIGEPAPVENLPRCDEWVVLSDIDIQGHYLVTMRSSTPIDQDYYACLVRELDARGMPDEANAVRGRMTIGG